MTMVGSWIRTLSVAAFVVAGGTLAAQAQTYPNQPLKLLVPFAAGGSADVLARIHTDRLAARLGQPVVLDNRPGASGNLGTAAAARLPADGYNLLFISPSFATAPLLYVPAPFDTQREFEPVALFTFVPNVLLVDPSLPVKSVAELVAYAKANPGKLAYGSSGSGTSIHLATELLKLETGIDILHVPYKAAAQATIDLAAGRLQILFDTTPTAIASIRSLNVRPLAVASDQRVSELPDVPTFAELGMPRILSGAWSGIAVPKGTPKAIIDRLNSEFTAIVAEDAVKARVREIGAQQRSGSPAEVGAFIQREVDKWGAVIKAANIKIE